jgi:hypothetical protein
VSAPTQSTYSSHVSPRLLESAGYRSGVPHEKSRLQAASTKGAVAFLARAFQCMSCPPNAPPLKDSCPGDWECRRSRCTSRRSPGCTDAGHSSSGTSPSGPRPGGHATRRRHTRSRASTRFRRHAGPPRQLQPPAPTLRQSFDASCATFLCGVSMRGIARRVPDQRRPQLAAWRCQMRETAGG